MVIDGLGYDFIMEFGKDSFLKDHLKDKITSVFPATTAAGITSFLTGLAPQQHAVTGWFVYLKELGMVTTILPFKPRIGSGSLSDMGIKPETIFLHKSIFENIKGQSFIVAGKDIIYSPYNGYYGKGTTRLPYNTLTGFLRQTKSALRIGPGPGRKFIYTYWPGFDALCHKYGPGGRKVKAHFKLLDRKIGDFARSLKGTDTSLIITADHGFFANDRAHAILLKDHPELEKKSVVNGLCADHRHPNDTVVNGLRAVHRHPNDAVMNGKPTVLPFQGKGITLHALAKL